MIEVLYFIRGKQMLRLQYHWMKLPNCQNLKSEQEQYSLDRSLIRFYRKLTEGNFKVFLCESTPISQNVQFLSVSQSILGFPESRSQL